MAIRKNQTRIAVTVDKEVWRKLKKLQKEYHLPVGVYSQITNQALTAMLGILEMVPQLKGKNDAERNVIFYKMMSQIMSDQAQTMMKLT